jgi:hypothetical protein
MDVTCCRLVISVGPCLIHAAQALVIGQTLSHSNTQPTKSRSAPRLARLVENLGRQTQAPRLALFLIEQQDSRQLLGNKGGGGGG